MRFALLRNILRPESELMCVMFVAFFDVENDVNEEVPPVVEASSRNCGAIRFRAKVS